MQDWKVNQKIFNALGVKTDLLGINIPADKIRPVSGNLIAAIDHQFNDCDHIWIPAKSYCVALVYATELVKDYGGTIYQYLDDSDLLPDDCYFSCYSENVEVYNYFITNTHWHTSALIDRIKDYYRREIHLEGFLQ